MRKLPGQSFHCSWWDSNLLWVSPPHEQPLTDGLWLTCLNEETDEAVNVLLNRDAIARLYFMLDDWLTAEKEARR